MVNIMVNIKINTTIDWISDEAIELEHLALEALENESSDEVIDEVYNLLYDTDEIMDELKTIIRRQKLDYMDAIIEFTESNISMYISINYNKYFDDLDIEINEIDTTE